MGWTIVVLVVVIGLLCLRLYAVMDEVKEQRKRFTETVASHEKYTAELLGQIEALTKTNGELSEHLAAERAKVLTSKGNGEHNPNVIRATNSGDVRRIFEKEVGGKPDE